MSSIGVSEKSKKRWKLLKNHPQESYENMINRIISDSIEDDSFSVEELRDIDEAVQELKEGNGIPHEQVMKEFT